MKSGETQNCFYCTEEFKPSAKWQIFCGDKCKTKWNNENVSCCFYCGDIATDRDHILPATSRGENRQFKNQETVRCCKECNVVLGSNMFSNIFDRLDFLINKYKSRYKLNSPAVKWSKKELAELGKTLRSTILKQQKQREKGENKVIFARYRKIELFNCLEDEEKEELFSDRPLVDTNTKLV